MKTKIKIAVLLAAVASAAVFFGESRLNAQTKVETAGQRFKNIKVLNDMPADQLGKVMNIMSASLGFNCAGCHVAGDKDFEKDGNAHKDTAREMLTMTFAINKQFFNGRAEVSCNTCHNGHERPTSAPNLNPVAPLSRPRQPALQPTAQQVLAKYAAAIGSGDIKSRTITATRMEPNGKDSEPETIIQAPGKLRVETKYGKYVVVESTDGDITWKSGGGTHLEMKADEAEQIKREAQLFGNTDLAKIYSKVDYRNVDRIDGREVYLLIGTVPGGARERLYFDFASGLLVRRLASTSTVLGPFQYQIDYFDYKDFGGVKIPTTVRYAVPAISWTRKITDVKVNTKIDESIFSK
jgi:hypothetical protein